MFYLNISISGTVFDKIQFDTHQLIRNDNFQGKSYHIINISFILSGNSLLFYFHLKWILLFRFCCVSVYLREIEQEKREQLILTL